MTLPIKLVDLPLTSFADRLAERTPTPGGGSVAAHLAQLGTALVTMAFRFTSGPKFAAVEGAMATRIEALESLRRRATVLVDRDTESYDAVSLAMKLPKESEADKELRTRAVQAALVGALEVPFETLETALAGLHLCAAGAGDVNPNLASDCATGALCLAAACESALMNVKINANSIRDKAYADARFERASKMQGEADRLLESIRAAARGKLG